MIGVSHKLLNMTCRSYGGRSMIPLNKTNRSLIPAIVRSVLLTTCHRVDVCVVSNGFPRICYYCFIVLNADF